MAGYFVAWLREGGVGYALVRRRVERALKAQDAQAAEMEAGGRHPRSCVRDVTAAVIVAERAVERAGESTREPRAWLDRVLVLLREEQERWRRGEEDEDGYGSATLHEISCEVEAIRDGR